MTKSNYLEMRLNGSTEVFVPLFDKEWTLPIYATFNDVVASDIPSCFAKTPRSSDWFKLKPTGAIHQAYRFKLNIKAVAQNAGEHKIKCLGRNWDEPSQETWKVELVKSLKISFVQGSLSSY